MALVPVQAVSAQSVGSQTSVTTPSFTSTSGNLLVANYVESAIVAFGATPIADNKTNTWANAIPSFADSINNRSAQDYAKSIVGGAGHTVTFSPGHADFIAVAVVEISGQNTTAPLDQKATGSSGGTSSGNPHATGNTPTTTQADEICVAGGTHSGSSNNTFASNNGYTVQTSQTNTTNQPIFLSTKVVSATGAQAESFSLTPNNTVDWTCMVATYTAAATTDPFPAGYGWLGRQQQNAVYRMRNHFYIPQTVLWLPERRHIVIEEQP